MRDLELHLLTHKLRLELLEAASIAWPNPTMFCQLPFSADRVNSGMEGHEHLQRQDPIDRKVAALYDPFIEPTH